MSSVNDDPKDKDSLNSSQLAWLKKMGAVLSIAFHIATPQSSASSSASGSASSQKQSEIVSNAPTSAEESVCLAPVDSLASQSQATVSSGFSASDGKPIAPEAQILGGAETEIEKKLAEFTQAMSSIVVNVNNQPVSVRPPYHINVGSGLDAVKDNRTKSPKVGKLFKEIFTDKDGATIGKATPDQMQKFLQGSVDRGLVKDTSSNGLRDFLDTYGISTDCSGLAVQALNFLADGDMDRGDNESIDALAVNTDKLATYKKNEPITTPSKLQPGDIMVKPGKYDDYIDPKDGKTKKRRVKIGHVRIITDVDEQDNSIYFTTLESTSADDINGIGERRWRFTDVKSFKTLQIQKGDQFKDASKGDRAFKYTRRE